MLFDEMCQTAKNIASQRMVGYNETVCVVCTRSGRVFSGVSVTTMRNNMPVATHAELEVCDTLARENDLAVAEMSLFSAGTFQPVLPCNDCAARIMSLDPYNVNTMIILPDRSVPLGQLGAFLQNMNMNPAPPPQPMGQFGGMPQGQFGGMAPQYMGGTSQYMGGTSQYVGSQYVGGGSSQYLNGGGSQYLTSAHLSSSGGNKDDGQYLKGRLNKLLSGEEEMDLEDLKAKKAEEKAAQKKKFKLF